MDKYYTTKDLKDRFHKKATRTFNNWRKARGFPEPVQEYHGGQNLYLQEDVHNWEDNSQKKKAA